MTIVAEADRIRINTPAGVEKFNSKDNMLYEIYSASGSLTLTANRTFVPLAQDCNDKLHVLFIKFTGGSGPVVSSLLNKEFVMEGLLLIDSGRVPLASPLRGSEVVAESFNAYQHDAYLILDSLRYTGNNYGFDRSAFSVQSLDYRLSVFEY
jgi:hypothetical protein